MKTVVVGDIHGQVEVVEQILALNQPTIFMGDFLDSFTRSVDDGAMCLLKVLSACEDRKDVQSLVGNHELSYMHQHMICSGYNMKTQAYVSLLRPRIDEYLKPYVWAEGFLISHSGVSQALLEALDLTLEEYLDRGKFHDIGWARGGDSRTGGLHWCDWNMEFHPIPEVNQIVGHTRGKGVREKEGSYCIDCLEDENPSVVFIEDGTLEVVPLEDLG